MSNKADYITTYIGFVLTIFCLFLQEICNIIDSKQFFWVESEQNGNSEGTLLSTIGEMLNKIKQSIILLIIIQLKYSITNCVSLNHAFIKFNFLPSWECYILKEDILKESIFAFWNRKYEMVWTK